MKPLYFVVMALNCATIPINWYLGNNVALVLNSFALGFMTGVWYIAKRLRLSTDMKPTGRMR